MLAERFKEQVAPALTKQFGYGSPMAVPRLAKVVVNMGVGEAVADVKVLDQAVEELAGNDRRSPRPGSRSPISSSARECRSDAA